MFLLHKQINNNFTLRDVLFILFSKRIVFISIFLLVNIITLLVVFLASPVYTSSATILVKPSDNAPVLIGSNAKRTILPVTMEYLNNEVALIRSKEVQKKTVFDLKLHEPDAPEKYIPLMLFKIKNTIKNELISLNILEKKDPVENAIFNLNEKIQVEAQVLSNIIVIRYSGENPDKNAIIVNAIVDNYIDKHIKVYQEMGGQTFLNNQRKLFKKALAQAEQKLFLYQQENNAIDPTNQIMSNLSVRESLLITVKNLEGETKENATRIQKLKHLLTGTTPSKNNQIININELINIAPLNSKATKSSMVTNQDKKNLILDKELREIPGIIEYQKALIALKIELGKATPRYTKESVIITDLKKQIYNLEMSMKRESEAILTGDTVVLHALENKKDEVEKQLNKIDKENLMLTKQQTMISQLKREIQIAENNYLLYTEKTEEARILAEKKLSKVVNVTIISSAEPASIPDFPKKKLLIIISIVMGCMAGLSGTVVANFLDHTLRTPQDIEDNTSLQYLGSVDYMKKARKRSSQDEQKQRKVTEQLEQIAVTLSNLNSHSGQKRFLLAGTTSNNKTPLLSGEIASMIARKIPDKTVLLVKNSHRLQLFPDSVTSGKKPAKAMEIFSNDVRPTTIKNMSMVDIADLTKTKISWGQIASMNKDCYDFIFYDYPFFSEKLHSDSVMKHVAYVVLVVEAGVSKWEILEQHTEAIRTAGGNITGALLNNRRYYIPNYIYKFL